MEFKDKLKQLRQQRGLSQQALADAIFVSRSAVAKWENGLGVPSQDSMLALQQYFSVDSGAFQTETPEEVIVEKNQKISTLCRWLTALFLAALLLYGTLTVLLVMGFRFTALSAAGGSFSDNPTIRDGEYHFFLSDDVMPTYAQAVRRYGFLYRADEGQELLLYDGDGCYIGVLKAFPGKQQIHYLLFTVGIVEKMETDGEESRAYVTYPWATEQITANGKTLSLEHKCYFVLEEPIGELRIKGQKISIVTEIPVD